MFGSVILEMAIGMVFIYLLLSLICSGAKEFISNIFSLRSKNLEVGIRNLLNDPEAATLAKEFHSHPLIKPLAKPGKKPSYIPSRTFSLALLNIIAPEVDLTGQTNTDDLKKAINEAKIIPDSTKKALNALLNDAGKDIARFRGNIENWFDDSMERVSGWYASKAQFIIFGCALVITVSLNVDTLNIIDSLMHDSALRQSIVAAAGDASQAEQIDNIKSELSQLNLPIGWTSDEYTGKILPSNCPEWIKKIFGLLITTFAISLGAPFWFGLLNKLISMRSEGKEPKKASEIKGTTQQN